MLSITIALESFLLYHRFRQLTRLAAGQRPRRLVADLSESLRRGSGRGRGARVARGGRGQGRLELRDELRGGHLVRGS